eukprot:679268_1
MEATENKSAGDGGGIQQTMATHALQHDQLKEKMHDLASKCVPLHQFTTPDIHNTIQSWVYDDIKYTKNLHKTMNILSRRALNGAKMSILSAEDLKDIVNNELKQFITPKTLIVMFKWFDHWMKTDGKQTIKTKSAEELGYMLYNCPLNRLLKRIHSKRDAIDGKTFIKHYKERHNWMEERTGWDKEDIYQIHSVLFRHHCFTSQQIMHKIQRISLTDAAGISVADTIQNTLISDFNLETLHYKIKTGQPVPEWSDRVVNMVNDMMDNNADDPHFIKQIYEAIAGCFTCDYTAITHKSTASKLSPLDQYQDWTCSNCSNHNFVCLVGSVMCNELRVCTLCGIQQIESVILLLRGSDTYVLVNSVVDDNANDCATEQDDIDQLIESVLQAQHFDLKCLYRNDNMPCPSILRLAKYLIQYKRWIHTVYAKTNGNDSTDKTVQVDISTYVTNDIYRDVFMESSEKIHKLTAQDMDQIRHVFNDEAHHSIKDVQTFLTSKRVAFAKLIQQSMKIKISCGLKLYSLIKYALQKQAQTLEFGRFLCDLDIGVIDEDYHHILHAHINQGGNATTIENVFKFFGYVVHYDDNETQIEMCRSVHRREQRMNTFHTGEMRDDAVNNMNAEDKDIWTLKQYYMQSQLDIIHSYLVHSNWKFFVQRHVMQNATEHTDLQQMNEKDSHLESSSNMQKYTTDLDESNTKYGFGVDFSHPHLKPIYDCIRYEVVFNKLYPLTTYQFEALLTKAIRTHKIAVSSWYRKELKFICKYFKREFNIIRNEAVGIRHILAIITYTDVSKFCTAFRSTYRQIGNETNTFQVTTRHRELYYYARCLYESVEFFGTEMDSKLKVYHGLNKVMKFHQFTAYFNQPISTSTSKSTGFQFSQGKGIILTLKSGSDDEHNASKIPKYLSVSWCSCFPNEDEKLFYGENVKFQIYNIIEAQTNQGHLNELAMLNKFQKTVQNQDIEWDETDKKTRKMIDRLEWLIHHQQGMNKKKNMRKDDTEEMEDDVDQEEESNKSITTYGKELFSYFCNNSNTTSIGIRNYTTLPSQLRNALFGSQGISFIPIINLFQCLTDITLDELEIGPFTTDAVHYFDAVLEYVKQCGSSNLEVDDLNQIKLYSEAQRDKKDNTTLQKLADSYGFEFKKYNWGVHYRPEFTGVHTLMFVKFEQVAQKGTFVKRNSKFNLFTGFNDPAPNTRRVRFDNIPDHIAYKWTSTDDLFENMSSKRSDIWHQTPSLFMQITSVHEDVFHLKLTADVINNQTKRRFRIINIAERSAVNVPITIYKKRQYAYGIDIDIEPEHGPSYHLAIHDPQHIKDTIIPNSNQIQFDVLKNENQYPPQNTEYRPHAIDVSTVMKVKDEVHDKVDIYWSLPTASLGKISYKIVDWKSLKQAHLNMNDNAEGTMVKLLPYQIPLASIPMSFRVITTVHLDGNTYHSEKSKVIRVPTDSVEPAVEIQDHEQANDTNKPKPHQIVGVITQSTTTEAFVTAEAVKDGAGGDESADIFDFELSDDDDMKDKGWGDHDKDDVASDDEEDEQMDEDTRVLIESFLDLKEPQPNEKMIEFLENKIHFFLGFLSRMPAQGPKIWRKDLAVDTEQPLPPVKPLSSDEPTEMRDTQRSYNIMRMFSDQVSSEEMIAPFLLRKCQEICLHALAVFHPTSSGNVYHGRVVLEILLNHCPKALMSAFTTQSRIKSLLKCALLRNVHQGNMNSFALDLLCFQNTILNGVSVQPEKIKLISMLAQWNLIPYVLKVACTSSYADDLNASKYASFFIDMVARSATVQEVTTLFVGHEELIVDSFLSALLNDELSSWQRAYTCGGTLIQFLDIASRPTIVDPSALLDMEDMLGAVSADPTANVFHSMFDKILARLHTFIPKLCETITSSASIPSPIMVSARTVDRPLGSVKLMCLELLTVAADFAQFECGKVLGQMPEYVWSELLNMAFIHRENNCFLHHFRRLIHLTMIFRRRILKSLFVKDKLLERFVNCYQNEPLPRITLHGFILQMLWDIYNHDGEDHGGDRENNDQEMENEEDQFALKSNFSDEKADEWDIVKYFDSHESWKGFSATLKSKMQLQSQIEESETGAQDMNIANNQAQLDQLLANLLGPSNDDGAEYTDSDDDSDDLPDEDF